MSTSDEREAPRIEMGDDAGSREVVRPESPPVRPWARGGRLVSGNDVKTALGLLLLVISFAWYVIALSDEFNRTSLAAQLGLSPLWGLPTNANLFLALYALTLLGILATVSWPALRRRFFHLPEGFPIVGATHGRLRRVTRYLFSLTLLELLLVVLVDIGLVSIRFLLYPFPQGSDTPQYIEAANRIVLRLDFGQMFPPTRLGTGRTLTVALVAVVRAVLSVIGPSADLVTAMVLPFLLTVVYSLAVSSTLHLLTQDSRLSFWGGLVAPASFLTIRLSYDLFSQYLGLSISMVAIALFLRYLSREGGGGPLGRYEGIVVACFFVLAMLAHMWSWAIMLVLALALVGWNFLAAPQHIRRSFKRALVGLGPSVAIMVVLLSVSSFVRYAVAYPVSVGAFTPFSLPVGWDWIAGWESAFVWFFAIVGFLALIFGRSTSLIRATILIWSAMISAMIFVLGFGDPARFIIMYPIPFLVVFGLDEVRRTLVLKAPWKGARRTQVDFAVAVGLTVILLATVVPTSYVAGYTYWPGEATYLQLQSIENAYGFSNSSVLILTDRAYFETGFQWASAITGDQVYSGNLFGLLRGDPFEREHLRWVYPDLSNVSEVLVPSTLYTPDAVERQFLSPGSAPGVSEYPTARSYDSGVLFSNKTLQLATNFTQDWALSTSTMNHTFTSSGTELNWSWPSLPTSPDGRWFTYDRFLAAFSEQSLYVLAGGSLGGANGEIDVFYSDQHVTTYPLADLPAQPSLIRMSLQAQETPFRVRVSFFVYQGDATGEGWFDIQFMAMAPA